LNYKITFVTKQGIRNLSRILLRNARMIILVVTGWSFLLLPSSNHVCQDMADLLDRCNQLTLCCNKRYFFRIDETNSLTDIFKNNFHTFKTYFEISLFDVTIAKVFRFVLLLEIQIVVWIFLVPVVRLVGRVVDGSGAFLFLPERQNNLNAKHIQKHIVNYLEYQ